MSKQLLNNFYAENLFDSKQLEAEVKNEVVYKKHVSGMFFEMSAYTKKEHFSLGYGSKIKSRNPIKYFYYDQTDNLQQTLANISFFILMKSIYLVWALWLIMEECSVILVLKVLDDYFDFKGIWFCF